MKAPVILVVFLMSIPRPSFTEPAIGVSPCGRKVDKDAFSLNEINLLCDMTKGRSRLAHLFRLLFNNYEVISLGGRNRDNLVNIRDKFGKIRQFLVRAAGQNRNSLTLPRRTVVPGQAEESYGSVSWDSSVMDSVVKLLEPKKDFKLDFSMKGRRSKRSEPTTSGRKFDVGWNLGMNKISRRDDDDSNKNKTREDETKLLPEVLAKFISLASGVVKAKESFDMVMKDMRKLMSGDLANRITSFRKKVADRRSKLMMFANVFGMGRQNGTKPSIGGSQQEIEKFDTEQSSGGGSGAGSGSGSVSLLNSAGSSSGSMSGSGSTSPMKVLESLAVMLPVLKQTAENTQSIWVRIRNFVNSISALNTWRRWMGISRRNSTETSTPSPDQSTTASPSSTTESLDSFMANLTALTSQMQRTSSYYNKYTSADDSLAQMYPWYYPSSSSSQQSSNQISARSFQSPSSSANSLSSYLFYPSSYFLNSATESSNGYSGYSSWRPVDSSLNSNHNYNSYLDGSKLYDSKQQAAKEEQQQQPAKQIKKKKRSSKKKRRRQQTADKIASTPSPDQVTKPMEVVEPTSDMDKYTFTIIPIFPEDGPLNFNKPNKNVEPEAEEQKDTNDGEVAEEETRR